MNKRRAVLAGVGLVLVIAAGLLSPSHALGAEPADSLRAGPEARCDGSFAPPRAMRGAERGILDPFSPGARLGTCDGRHREPFLAASEPRAVRLVPATGVTLIVPDEYETIQAAIDAAAPGDTVYVRAGTYFEHVVVDKQIVLQGQDADSTIIDGGGSGPVVELSADGVTIQGFTIQHGGMGAPWEWDPTWCGLRTSSVQYARIADCRLTGNAVGMLLSGFSYGTIERCLLSDNHRGIVTYCAPEPDAMSENCYNYIVNNVFSLNTISAIYFTHDPYDGSNLIQGNTIAHNGIGIIMWYAWDNDISHNSFINNSGFAIAFDMCGCGGYRNIIHHNTFIDNNGGGIQAEESTGAPYGVNYWYSPALGVGNHWSDYTGTDADHDGLGDTAYVIPENGNDDLYPLMHPFVPADMNLDGIVNVFDIDPFVLALADPSAYRAQYLVPAALHGDCNYDGLLNAFDIDVFVYALINPGEAIVPPNNPPDAPSGPTPPDGAIGVAGPILRWTGGDPDTADFCVYDVYCEAGNPTPEVLVCASQTEPEWCAGTWQGDMTYYWRIVARDRHGTETAGPVWSFCTAEDVWTIDTVVSTAASDSAVALAMDRQEVPHVSYVGRYPHALHYARRTGDEWCVETLVASGVSRTQLSIAVDQYDVPHISYCAGGVWYGHRTESEWVIQQVDGSSTLHCALALDVDGRPHIAYVGGSRVLKYAHWDGSAWLIETIEGAAISKTAIACDSGGHPHICYRAGSAVKYAVGDGTSWTTATVYAGAGSIRACSLALTADDQPRVSFVDSAAETLNYAAKVGDGWTIETLATMPCSSIVADSSVRLDAFEQPHIACTLCDSGYGYGLFYLRRVGSDWAMELVDIVGASSLSLSLDSDGHPHVAYRKGYSGEVRYASRVPAVEGK